MRKIFNLTCILATIAIFFSCSKESVPTEQHTNVTDGYTKVIFTAGVETKTTVGDIANDRTSIHWTGNEPVNIWYKDVEGKAQKVAAEFVSHSGREAVFSALIPNDAEQNEFIAEVNGVIENDKLPFSSSGARCEVPSVQDAVFNSFDPDAASMGAWWVKSDEKPSPEFTFYHLTNLLKITVNNTTDKTINKIVLNNTTSIANKNYWVPKAGYVSMSGSVNGATEVSLNGEVQNGDYYFVISKKNNGTFTLKDITVTFYFEDGYYRTFSNPNDLELGNNLSRCVDLGDFTLKSEDLQKDVDDSSWAPFGTAWGNTQIKNATPLTEQYWYVAYAKSPNSSAVANFKTTKDIGPDGKYLQGDVTFEFVTKSTGTGVLTFTLESAKANSHESIVYVNGVEKQRFQYEQAWTRIAKSAELTVNRGDRIKITANNGSNNQKLYFYSSVDHSITWNEKQ